MSENLMDRRGFMKSSVAGVGSFFYLASNDKRQEEKKQGSRKVVYRDLGKTGIKLPVVSWGTAYIGSANMIRTGLDAGIIHLDTAQNYQRGRSEEIIGEAIKGRPRDSYFIATRIFTPKERISFLPTPQATEEAFLKSLEVSLKRLGLEYVDILYQGEIARREGALHEPILKAMEKAKKEGKAKFLGISTHKNEPEVIQASIDSQLYDVVLTSYNFRQKHYIEVRQAIAKAAQAGLGVIAMKVMGGLTIDPLSLNAPAALKWVLQDPNVTTTVLGFCTFEEMETDLSVMEDLALKDSEEQWLQKQASLPGLYCQQCGKCMNQCLARIPIPDIMRAYMYAYAHRQPAFAQNLIASLDLPQRVCEDCSSCPVKCLNGWNVSRKIRDVVRLRDVPSGFLV
jgi:uncharacterized protein